MSRRAYLLNGNSSASLTAHMASLAAGYAGPDFDFEADTVTAAPPFVADRVQAARAGAVIVEHVAARFARKNAPRLDGVLLGCFGEPGLLALRTMLDVPVVGMVEASALTAMQLGHRFSILTAGADWPDQIEDLLHVYGVAGRCRGILSMRPEATSSEPAVWQSAMQADLEAVNRRYPANVIVIGGGFTAGRAAALVSPPGVQVLDCFLASLAQLAALMRISPAG